MLASCLSKRNRSLNPLLNVLMFQPYVFQVSVHCESFIFKNFVGAFMYNLMIHKMLNELFLYLTIVIQKIGVWFTCFYKFLLRHSK